MPADGSERRAAPRLPIRAQLRFKPTNEVREGITVDLSETGIHFETDKPLRILMEILVGRERERKYARLAWARRRPDGKIAYGFEFEEKPPEEA